MKKIVILTGSELRHVFFRKFIGLSQDIEIINTYCEGAEESLRAKVERNRDASILRLRHLSAREQSERDFFSMFVENTVDLSQPVFLLKGKINTSEYTETIINSKPDILIAYGCSIIKEPLLSAFKGRFINVHLGLSPYYRGTGSSYWPLVNNEPEYVGATFMHINAGIDTGEVIHQIRARYSWGDTPSQIGNRLICDMASVCRIISTNFERLEKMPQMQKLIDEKAY